MNHLTNNPKTNTGMKRNYHQEALNKYGSPLTTDQFNEFVESVITASQSTPGSKDFAADHLGGYTVEEMEAAYNAGYKRGDDQQNVRTPDGNIYPTFKQFIQSLKH